MSEHPWMESPILTAALMLFVIFFEASSLGQGVQPYPNAVTNRSVITETPMRPPAVNVRFVDPDFGSKMIRVTDEKSNFRRPGSYFRTEGSGNANLWSADTTKFYVVSQGGSAFAYSFNPSTMKIGSLPRAKPGQAFLLPLRAGGSFSFIDPDLIYGTTDVNFLTISSYRFSTGVTSAVIDTTTCGTQPPLIPGPDVRSDDDVSPSLDDQRISISEGGPSFDKHMFVIVYDKRLGCRWYNTQTGQIGGQWGLSGAASTSDTFLIAHAYLSRSGKYMRVGGPSGWYVWDIATLNVTECRYGSDLHCDGYKSMGYNSVVQNRILHDPMDIVKRPFGDVAEATPLVWPLPTEHDWGLDMHFTWSNVDVNDSVPVCASSYFDRDRDGAFTHPFEGEIYCLETDGIASTIWRFAHHRAHNYSEYFNTQPLGNISRDGRFFLFTSTWDQRLGTETDGTPRSDVWIVKLE